MPKIRPTCWKCNYDLAGLRIDDLCPECGTAVWSAPPGTDVIQAARDAQKWGMLALILMFACLGPLAGFLAIPAITNGRYAMNLYRTGRVPEGAIKGAKAGLICGWITVVLSIITAILYVIFLPLF